MKNWLEGAGTDRGCPQDDRGRVKFPLMGQPEGEIAYDGVAPPSPPKEMTSNEVHEEGVTTSTKTPMTTTNTTTKSQPPQ